MDGNEMPHCDYCNTRRKCIKSFTIQKFPKYLVIREFNTLFIINLDLFLKKFDRFAI